MNIEYRYLWPTDNQKKKNYNNDHSKIIMTYDNLVKRNAHKPIGKCNILTRIFTAIYFYSIYSTYTVYI